MRRTTTTIIALAGLLVSGAASAAETTKETGKTGASEPTGAPTGDLGGGKTGDISDTRDRPTDTTFANKTWGVNASLEYHHVGLTPDYIDNGAARNGVYLGVGARWGNGNLPKGDEGLQRHVVLALRRHSEWDDLAAHPDRLSFSARICFERLPISRAASLFGAASITEKRARHMRRPPVCCAGGSTIPRSTMSRKASSLRSRTPRR